MKNERRNQGGDRSETSKHKVYQFDRAVTFGIPPFLDCSGDTSGKQAKNRQEKSDNKGNQESTHEMNALAALFGGFSDLFCDVFGVTIHLQAKDAHGRKTEE